MIAQRGFPVVLRLLSSQFTVVGNVGAGVDSLMTYSVLAGQLRRNGDALRIVAAGRCTNNANAKKVGMTFSTVQLLGAIQDLTVSIDGSWVIEVLIVRRSATQLYFTGKLFAGTTGGNIAEFKSAVGNEVPAMNLDTTAYSVTVNAEAVDDNDVTQRMMTVEYIPGP